MKDVLWSRSDVLWLALGMCGGVVLTALLYAAFGAVCRFLIWRRTRREARERTACEFDQAADLPVRLTVRRTRVRCLGWQIATVYTHELRGGNSDECMRSRWLYFRPEGIGFGLSLPAAQGRSR